MSQAVSALVEGKEVLAIALVGNDRRGAPLAKPLAQIIAVVGAIRQHLLGRLRAPDQALGRRTIMRLTAGQQDGKKTAFNICDCVDFRIAPAARASNSLRLLPPFPPDAERCALM
jgi:hypothetical protein